MSTYRDDLEAAQARADALERENAELREQKAALERKAAAPEEPAEPTQPARPRRKQPALYVPTVESKPPLPLWRKLAIVGLVICLLLGLVATGFTSEERSSGWDIVLIAAALVGGLMLWLALGAPADSD